MRDPEDAERAVSAPVTPPTRTRPTPAPPAIEDGSSAGDAVPPPAPTATHSWPPVPVLKAKTAPASDPKLTVLPSEESAGDEAKAEPAAKAHSCEPVSAAHERGIGQHREEDCSVGALFTPKL